MQKTQRFFKFKDEWYADVPGHTFEDNQMVAGADTVLEEIDRNGKNSGEVFMTVADRVDTSALDIVPFLVKFVMKKHDKYGAVYILTGPLAEYYDAVGFEIWICNVTHDVFGEHPQSIYVIDIK